MVSFSYAFPDDSLFLKTRTRLDWMKAIAALGSRNNHMWRQFSERPEVEVKLNEVTVEFKVLPGFIPNMRDRATDVSDLADILVKGPKCR